MGNRLPKERVLCYDPLEERRSAILAALRDEFDLNFFASMAELSRELKRSACALVLDGSPDASGNTEGAPLRLVLAESIPLGTSPPAILRLVREFISADHPMGIETGFIEGSNADMRNAVRELEDFADSERPLLIIGETGVGKDRFAQAAHSLSRRSGGPYLAYNCANLGESIADSTLFGSQKGGFTDAVDRRGLFGEAHGGTLFLDEIGSMPLPVQSKLLRAVEGGGFRRVGGERTEHADARIVTATCEDLHERVCAGKFREDLLYRLSVLEIWIPPLRERRDDIPTLARHFCHEISGGRCMLSGSAVEALCEYPWPGNVRELKSVVERSVILAKTGIIGAELLAGWSPAGRRRSRVAPGRPTPA